MPRIVEKLDGGLVTSKDFAMLDPGELTQCINFVYLPNRSGLQFVAGCTVFSAQVAGAGVQGLGTVRFTNGTQVLIAAMSHSTNSIYTAPVGDTGALTVRDTQANIGSGPLEAVHYQDKVFMFTGVTANRVMLNDLTTRQHGITAVTSAPIVAVTTGTTWSDPTVTFPGSFYYEYWTTEVIKYSDGSEIESTIDVPTTTPPTTVMPTAVANITAATQGVTVTRPALANSGATHWRVYRNKRVTKDVSTFPVAFRIAELPITSTTAAVTVTGCTWSSGVQVVDTTSTFGSVHIGDIITGSGGLIPAGAYVLWVNSATRISISAVTTGAQGGGGVTLTFTNSTAKDTVVFNDNAGAAGSGVFAATQTNAGVWTNAANALAANDGVFATTPTPNATMTMTFDLSSLSVLDPVTGLQVDVWHKSSFLTSVDFQISVDGGSTYGSKRTVTAGQALVQQTLGGSFDQNWGVPVTANGLSGTNFKVKLTVRGVAITPIYSLDAVKVTPTFSNAPGNTGDPFPSVVIAVGDKVGIPSAYTGVGRNGKPPLASTADVFEDSLVTNDTTNVQYIRYSVPGLPHYFPSIYWVQFQTDDSDQVTCIRTLGSRLMVGLQKSLWRVNYLPNQDDASFNRGRAIELISPQYGVTNAHCSVVYHGPDGRPELAFVNLFGLFSTDGYVIRELTNDLDFQQLLSGGNPTTTGVGAVEPICLINNAKDWELVYYFRAVIGSHSPTQYKFYELHFSYHPQHLKDGGKLKISGPCNKTNGSVGSTNYGPAAVCPVHRFDVSATQNQALTIYVGISNLFGSGGQIYRDDYYSFSGWDALGTTPTNIQDGTITTRGMYLAGFGQEFKLNETYVYSSKPSEIDNDQFSGTISVQPILFKTGTSNAATTSAKSFTAFLASPLLSKLIFDVSGECAQFTLTSTCPNVIESLVVDYEDFGTEESGV
jgi:hypothetical protein